jgi:hypothetical protein
MEADAPGGDGRHTSISELAVAQKIDRRNVGGILRLPLLASDLIEAILNGSQPGRPLLPPRLLGRGAYTAI